MKTGSKNNSLQWSLILMILLVGIFLYFYQASLVSNTTTVAFLDVGQGDAIYIEAPNGVQVLVDSGQNAGVVRELGSVMPFWDRSIDIIIPTHADKDHIGGFPEILKRFDVETVYKSQTTSDTAIYREFLNQSSREGATILEAWADDTIILDQDAGVYLRILYPDRNVANDPKNEASTIVQLVHGEIEVLLTGDAGKDIERLLLFEYGDFIESEILKIGHHGSKTSTDPQFISVVDPEYVVISAGEGNRYGHPHSNTMETLENHGTKILETSKEGTIVFKIDGQQIQIK
jgi:competence protein ComEC